MRKMLTFESELRPQISEIRQVSVFSQIPQLKTYILGNNLADSGRIIFRRIQKITI